MVDLRALNHWRSRASRRASSSEFGAWSGLNLPWLNYGRDFGTDPTAAGSSGYSADVSRAWLRNLLSLVPVTALSRRQNDLFLRIFVGTDWRQGLTYEDVDLDVDATPRVDGSYASPFLAFERFKEAIQDGDDAAVCGSMGRDAISGLMVSTMLLARQTIAEDSMSEEAVQVRRVLAKFNLRHDLDETTSSFLPEHLARPCSFLVQATRALHTRLLDGGFMNGHEKLTSLEADGPILRGELGDEGAVVRRILFVEERDGWKIHTLLRAGEPTDIDVPEERDGWKIHALLRAGEPTDIDVPDPVYYQFKGLTEWSLKYLQPMEVGFAGGLGVALTNYTTWFTTHASAGVAAAPMSSFLLSAGLDVAESFHRWDDAGLSAFIGAEVVYAHAWSEPWNVGLLGPTLGLQLDFTIHSGLPPRERTQLIVCQAGFIPWFDVATHRWSPGAWLKFSQELQ